MDSYVSVRPLLFPVGLISRAPRHSAMHYNQVKQALTVNSETQISKVSKSGHLLGWEVFHGRRCFMVDGSH